MSHSLQTFELSRTADNITGEKTLSKEKLPSEDPANKTHENIISNRRKLSSCRASRGQQHQSGHKNSSLSQRKNIVSPIDNQTSQGK